MLLVSWISAKGDEALIVLCVKVIPRWIWKY
jgi:hypothetical protein